MHLYLYSLRQSPRHWYIKKNSSYSNQPPTECICSMPIHWAHLRLLPHSPSAYMMMILYNFQEIWKWTKSFNKFSKS